MPRLSAAVRISLKTRGAPLCQKRWFVEASHRPPVLGRSIPVQGRLRAPQTASGAAKLTRGFERSVISEGCRIDVRKDSSDPEAGHALFQLGGTSTALDAYHLREFSGD